MKRKLLLIVASLLVGSMMYAQDMHWTWTDTDVNAYQTNMHITGRAYLDGELVTDRGDIEVATFVGDQLRGTKMLVNVYPSSTLGYFVWTNCFYTVEGETFTFKAFDHASGIEYDLCPTQLVGQQSGHGSIDDPVLMYFTRSEEPISYPEHPWVPSTIYTGEGMMVTAQIQIDGQLVDRDSYEVGAFCGDECRADITPLTSFADFDLGYFAFLNVLGIDGDMINFYLWDTQNDCIVEAICNTTITLQNGGEIGIDVFNDTFVLNFKTVQTFTKDITHYTEGERDKYYLIASPIGTVDVTAVDNMITESTYDLYSFDQSGEGDETYDFLEWRNYDAGQFTQLEAGKGYLYANSEDVTLTFTGFAYDGDATFPLDYDANANLKGWNLVGNPFAVDVYPNRPYYKMNEDGTEIMSEGSSAPVAAMEGVFVVANGEGETVTFNIAEGDKNSNLVLNLSKNSSVIDRVIVSFDESRQLPKFQLNPNHTKVYVSQEGNDYAIVNASEMGEMPVSFKAENNGSYTLSFTSQEVSFNYLHLIDNMAGTDTDLLANPSYSFEAKKSDYPTRFKLVFATGNSSDDNFAFFSNGNWIISNEGEATLQVVDALGRILSSETISGSCSKAIHAAPGVYMLRLINGDNMKVQKVVVE